MLSPVHLRAVEAVHRSGSIADAARELGYTSSAVSQQISQVERSLQLVLFEREAQRIRSTPAAEYLASRASETLAKFDSLIDDMRSIANGTAGRLRLGSFPTASQRLVPGAVARYLPKQPDVRIALDEEEPDALVPRLESGDLDLVIVYSYDSVPRVWSPSIECVDLFQEDLVLILPAHHPARDSSELALADLRDETWVCTREGTAGSNSLQLLCGRAGFEPMVEFRSNDYDVVHQFVRSGLGVALVPASSLPVERMGDTRRLVDVDTRRHIQALCRESRINPAIAGMLNALRRSAGELARSWPGVVV